jgi:hypothetical protein
MNELMVFWSDHPIFLVMISAVKITSIDLQLRYCARKAHWVLFSG